MPPVPPAISTLLGSLLHRAWIESLLGLVVSFLSGKTGGLSLSSFEYSFKLCARQCVEGSALGWALCYHPISVLQMKFCKIPMNLPYSLGSEVASPLPCMGHLNSLREGDQGSGHRVITCFLNEQRGCVFPPPRQNPGV